MRKYSHQRELVLNFIKQTKTHPTAMQVCDAVRTQQPNISLATVYRNLNLLCESGEACSFKTNDGSEHFDGCTDIHSHFCCTQCGKIYDVFINSQSDCADVEATLNCKVKNKQVTYYGICDRCFK